MFSKFLKCQIILTIICYAFCYEPTEKDLECFNDYETEIKCSLSTDHLKSCSGYKLNITHNALNTKQMYPCVFERSHLSDNCECKIKIQGFVVTEIFNTTLLEGTRVLLSKTIMTKDFIKPKSPILSVQKNENGNFNVTWHSQYEKSVLITKGFLEDLSIHLTYGIKGDLKNISKTLENTLGFSEIAGKNLQSNTIYILTATMSTAYNGHNISSDQSAPVEFTTSSSPTEIAKMVIPPLCIGLIIIIFTVFFCILRMKINWWDKISKPKIAANLGHEKGHILPPSVITFFPIHVEIPTMDLQEDKNLISASSIDTNDEKGFHSVESSSVDYGQAHSSSSEKKTSSDNITPLVQQALKESLNFPAFTSNPSPPSSHSQVTMSRSDKSVNGIGSSREHIRANRDSGNCSGSSVFSNMSYSGSSTGDSSFLERLSSNHERQSGRREVADSDAGDSQFNSPANVTLEDGYQCFNSVSGKGNDADVCVNLSDDFGADAKCMKNLITSPNPLYPLILHDASDEGHQAFRGLTVRTEGQWSKGVSTEQALNACGALKFLQSTGQDPTSVQHSSQATSLHFSPVIQMDSSYHCV